MKDLLAAGGPISYNKINSFYLNVVAPALTC